MMIVGDQLAVIGVVWTWCVLRILKGRLFLEEKGRTLKI